MLFSRIFARLMFNLSVWNLHYREGPANYGMYELRRIADKILFMKRDTRRLIGYFFENSKIRQKELK